MATMTNAVCEACLEKHRCAYCCDGGRVRVTEGDRHHPMFGKTTLCPECQGTTGSEIRKETLGDADARMRIPLLYRLASIDSLALPQRHAIGGILMGTYPEKPFLVMTGPPGTGKTYAAIVALREYCRKTGYHGQFWPVVDLLEEYRSTIDESRATRTTAGLDAILRSCRLLILDDFGKQKSTEWAEQQLFRIIDQRLRDMMPTVITSNVAPATWDEAVRSRLVGKNHSEWIELTGEDRRSSNG